MNDDFNRWRPLQKITTRQKAVWSPLTMDTSTDTPASKAQGTLWETENQGVGCEIVSPCKVRSYSHEHSQTWLPKHELKEDDRNWYI